MVLRKIRQILNEALGSLDGEFSKLQASGGRPLIAPERLLRASPLQASFAQHASGMMPQLMEQLDYNLKFRWFVGLGIDDLVWDGAPPR